MTIKIETEKLILRPIEMNDTERLNELCNDKAIASNNVRMPYPKTLEDTKSFIEEYSAYDIKKGAIFSIILKETNEIIGAIGLICEPEHERGEMGYWIGKDYWGKGYCSEAAKAVLDFGFKTLNLHRVFAWCMKENEASRKVLQKIGMQYEGCLKGHVKKDGVFKDMVYYGMEKLTFLSFLKNF